MHGRKPSRRSFLASLSWVALLIVVPLLFYVVYVLDQSNKVQKRNLRVLDRAARNVEAVLENAQQTVKNLSRNFSTACRFAESQPYLQFVEPADCEDMEGWAASEATVTDLRLVRGPRLLIYAWREGVAPGSVECGSMTSSRLEQKWGCFNVALDLGKILAEAPLEEAFESLLISDESGRIVQQHGVGAGEGGLRLRELPNVPDAGKNVPDASKSEDSRTLSLQWLQRVGRVSHVRLGNEDYQLFSQPLTLNTYVSTEGRESWPRSWILCGLMPSDLALEQALAVAPQLVFALVLLLILGLLTWPFIKLLLMARQERFRFIDAYFLALSTFALLLLLTILLQDLDSYRALRVRSDQSLEDLAGEVELHLQAELSLLRKQLQDFDRFFCEHCDVPNQLSQLGIDSTIEAKSLLDGGNGDAYQCDDEMLPALSYDFFSSIFWMDGDGLQRIKATVSRENTPAVVLSGREYFRRVRDRRLWQGPEEADFFVESYRSITTGERHSALSMQSCFRDVEADGSGPLIAAAISIAPLALTDPLLPPGFGFAVIDDDGRTLYHSDGRRALSENMLAEVAAPARLESALFSRTAQNFYTHYLTRPHQMFVRPIRQLPWSIVTFRDKEILRTVNLEALVQALLLAIAYLFLCYLLPSLVLVRLGGRRTRWLWPDSAKLPLYRRLSLQLFTVLLLSLLVLPNLAVDQRLASSFLIPLAVAALVGISFLLFHRRERGDAGLPITTPTWPRNAAAREIVRWWWNEALLFWHLTSVILLWCLIAILPAVGFFRVAWEDQMQAFARYEGLHLLAGYDARACRIEKHASLLPLSNQESFMFSRRAESLDVYLPGFEDGRFEELGRKATDARLKPIGPGGGLGRRLIQDHKPFYNQTSIYLRYLGTSAAADASWRWMATEQEMSIELVESECAGALRFRAEGRRWRPTIGSYVLWGGLLCLLLLVLWVRYSATRMFFLRISWQVAPLDVSVLVDRPYRSNVIALIASPFDRRMILSSPHYVCVDLAKARLDSLPLEEGGGKPVVCDHFEDGLRDPENRRRKLDLLEKLAFEREGNVVILSSVDPFESFEWLGEAAAREAGRDIPLIPKNAVKSVPQSEARAAVGTAMDTVGGIRLREDEARRWGRLLSAFVLIPVSLRRYREPSGSTEPLKDAAVDKAIDPGTTWLNREFSDNPQLESLVKARIRGAWPKSRREALERILEALEGFYLALWTACSEDEKLVLVQLAQERFVNPKQARTVRRLLQRGLILRDPVLRPINESFRLFIERVHEPLQVSRWEASVRGLGWTHLRWPFLAILAVTGIFLFATQKDIFDTSIAFISALALGLPGLLRLVSGLHRGRISRSEG